MRSHKLPIEQLEVRRLLATVPAGFTDQILTTLADQPTSQVFAPDGRTFVTLEGTNDTSGPAEVRVFKNGALLGTPLLTVTTQSFFERGLLGIAVHPDFANNGYVYVYYTVPTAQTTTLTHRVQRWTVPPGSDVATPGSNVQIFDIAVPVGQSSAGNHNGGAMGFGPDGKLYIAVGDNAVSSNSQTLNNLFGKMLRINDDGTIPSDNPFFGTATGVNRAIWALGLRNPFTFAFQPGTGRLYINDVGSSGAGRREEVNEGLAGANYGWPTIEGFRVAQPLPSIGTYRDPVHAYNDGIAITGGMFYNPQTPMFPATYNGRYFYGDYVSGFFRTLIPTNTPPLAANAFGTGASGPVDFDLAPDGSIWYIEYTSRRVRRIYVDSSLLPSIQQQPGSQTVSLEQPATFETSASNATGIQWQRNNVDIPGATGNTYTLLNPTLADNGAVFRAVATNASGQTASNGATLTVLDNFLPDPTITSPSAGGTFVVGQTINFSGTASDRDDGELPASAFDWVIRYTTGAVTRPPILQVSDVTGGSFVAEVTPAHRGIDVTYEVVLTVTDSDGAQRTVVQTLTPIVSNVTLATNVPGLTVEWDGTIFPANFNFDSIVGREWNIATAATQVLGNQTYQFQNWSDGGAASHNITVGFSNTTITATFADITPPAVESTAFLFDQPVPANAPHTVRIGFSEAVGASLLPSDVQVVRLDDNTPVPSANIAIAYDTGTNVANVTFPGLPGGVLPNGNYRVTLAAGAIQDGFGNANAAPAEFDFFVLAGDADRNRTIDIDDFGTLAQNFNLPGLFSEGDFDYSGTIDIDDFAILAQDFNESLPAARPSAGGAAGVKAPAAFGSVFADDRSELLEMGNTDPRIGF